MKLPTAYLASKSPLALAAGASVVLIVIYVLGRKAVKDVAAAASAGAEVAAGVLTGDNLITASAKNASGESTDAYKDRGILGTLGAGTNAILGGIPATLGENLGGWFFDKLGPKTPIN